MVNEGELHQKVTAQGDKLRDLKAKKADKTVITKEVDILKTLKKEYKDCTGKEYVATAAAETPKVVETTSTEASIHAKVMAQGEKLRVLKANKGDKAEIKKEVDALLALKNEYKEQTGKEYVASAVVETPKVVEALSVGGSIYDKVTAQGEKLRLLKANKGDKAAIKQEVDALLALKKEYKEQTGKEYVVSAVNVAKPAGNSIYDKVTAQGEKIRILKANKGDKAEIKKEVDVLLTLKKEFKEQTGEEYALVPVTETLTPNPASDLYQKVTAQGDKIRDLKAKKADKNEITKEVEALKALKKEYKDKTGQEYAPGAIQAATATPKAQPDVKAVVGKKIVESPPKEIIPIIVQRKNLPYTALLTLHFAGFDFKKSLQVIDDTDNAQTGIFYHGQWYCGDIAMAKFIARASNKRALLLGSDFADSQAIENVLSAVNRNGTIPEVSAELLKNSPSFSVVAKKTTLADFALFTHILNNPQLKEEVHFANLFNKILAEPTYASVHHFVGLVDPAKAEKMQLKPKEKMKDEGKFIELPGAEKGKVVVRFPPEASGYLHIGHAKAALLNQYYQQTFEGQLIMRFDDTNPAKENAHFEEIIKEDLKTLNIVPDRWTHSSDHFDLLSELCEKCLREGKAFVDDTDSETMRNEREARQESANRNNSVAKNLALWEEMKKGSDVGVKNCVRIKIDMKSNNGALRDPTIYRCKPETHIKTGDKYKVYPTYDFTCPVVDSLEGVTHALRTTEYEARDDQYYFICEALGIRKPYIWSYARLNMTHTLMSKRKLTCIVDEGIVCGWNDPRLPTVRGVMRRGLTVEALKTFIIAQGGSRSVVTMDWTKIWAFNERVIDPVSPRYTGLTKDGLVVVSVTNCSNETNKDVDLHPKNPDLGKKVVVASKQIYVEQEDAKLMKEGDIVTFMHWGNMNITKIVKKGDTVQCMECSFDVDNTDFKNTLKVTWLAMSSNEKTVTLSCSFYDYIISKDILSKEDDWKQFINKDSHHVVEMMGEHSFQNMKKGDIVQIQRKNFFICDEDYNRNDNSVKLIAIPGRGSAKN
uniref:Glutamate--tRNA ligase n=1 Tax=Rhabditophanes sp. KR3021 TaxID=114890 RepID=A0AC35UFV8_9BILA